MKPDIKKCLKLSLQKYDGPFSVLMSGGFDSHAVLFSLLELGVKVHTYSFTLDDRESRDFRAARETARALSLPFTPVYLPTDLKKVKIDCFRLVNDMGLTSKAAIESLFGIVRTCDIVKHKNIASGLAAGLFFVETKRGCMHYKDRTDEYRLEKFPVATAESSQTSTMRRYCESIGKVWTSPWLTKRMLSEFQGTTWDEINKPKLKQPLHTQFSGWKNQPGVRVFAPQSLQLGDSGISELFAKLLDDPDWNRWEYKSTVGLFNRIRSGDIKC